MQKKLEVTVKTELVEVVECGIDKEVYNCEISEHIFERTREETDLVKEKVKEMMKVIKELDKKITSAKILETHAIHSKEEVLIE